MVRDMKIRLKYVYRERMPSGNWRHRFQKDGKKVTLEGEPGSHRFMAKYADLLSEHEEYKIADTFGWLVEAYLAHFADQVRAGQRAKGTLDHRRRQLTALLDDFRDNELEMPRSAVIKIRDSKAATPAEANNTVKALRAMYAFAIERGLASRNPCDHVGKLKVHGSGFEAWTVEDLRKYAKAHPEGTMAHLCLSLAMFTAARRSDLCRLGRQHEKMIDGRRWLSWTQKKTGHLTEIPMMPQLEREARLVGGDMTYLLSAHGGAYTVAGLGNRFRAWSDEAGVSKSLHGIRKAVPSLLAEVGVTPNVIMVLLGHTNTRQGEVYTASADRRVMALSLKDELQKVRW